MYVVTVEQKSTKTTSNAITVAEQTPANANPFDLSKMDPKAVAMAEKAGIPLTQMMLYMNSVEERFRDIESTLPGKVADALQQRAIQRQAAMQAAQPQQPQQQARGGGMDQIPWAQILGGGGGEDSPMQKLAMESLRASINQGNAITAAVVSKITGKAVTEIAADLVK